MGVESYLLRLTGQQDVKAIGNYLTSALGAHPDSTQSAPSGSDQHFVIRDGRHVIEFELAQRGRFGQLSVRFAICHPASLDDVFVSIVASLMAQLQMTATICEVLPAGTPSEYDATEVTEFAANCRWSIDSARKEWHRAFGPEEAGVSVSDACRKYYLGENISP
jgi:hypothetical protein